MSLFYVKNDNKVDTKEIVSLTSRAGLMLVPIESLVNGIGTYTVADHVRWLAQWGKKQNLFLKKQFPEGKRISRLYWSKACFGNSDIIVLEDRIWFNVHIITTKKKDQYDTGWTPNIKRHTYLDVNFIYSVYEVPMDPDWITFFLIYLKLKK